MQKTKNKTVKAWDLKLETSFFPFVTQDLSMFESLLFFYPSFGFGHVRADSSFFSLLVQILGILGPTALLSLAQVLNLLEPIFFISEVHV